MAERYVNSKGEIFTKEEIRKGIETKRPLLLICDGVPIKGIIDMMKFMRLEGSGTFSAFGFRPILMELDLVKVFGYFRSILADFNYSVSDYFLFLTHSIFSLRPYSACFFFQI